MTVEDVVSYHGIDLLPDRNGMSNDELEPSFKHFIHLKRDTTLRL